MDIMFHITSPSWISVGVEKKGKGGKGETDGRVMEGKGKKKNRRRKI